MQAARSAREAQTRPQHADPSSRGLAQPGTMLQLRHCLFSRSLSSSECPMRQLSPCLRTSTAQPRPSCFSLVNARRNFHASEARAKKVRAYLYTVDVHGQLFLSRTEPKNLTSCFKSTTFLDFFYARVKPNDTVHSEASPTAADEQAWESWEEGVEEEEAKSLAAARGFQWISPCQGEMNLIRAVATPIVFRELSEDGQLSWAGTYTLKFDPSALRVHPETGYVYHPSPPSPLPSAQRRAATALAEGREPEPSPFGRYSLLSSALVLSRLAEELELDPANGGTVVWEGKRWELGVLQEGDTLASVGDAE